MTLFSPLIEQAAELAAQWHDGTYRKSQWRAPAFALPDDGVLRVPVVAHVTAVALIVQRAGWDDVTVAAAFLHDVLEDANRFGHTFRREHLRRCLGEAVAVLVEAVSEQKHDAEGNWRSWQDRKDGYIEQLRSAPPEALAISLADKLHNLWTMNASLEAGIDIFSKGNGRRPLSAGPERQRWFYRTVLETSERHADARLVPLRAQMAQELQRFEHVLGEA